METGQVLSTASIESFRRGWKIIGSSNGLLCVVLDMDETCNNRGSLCLWNPMNNEIREVPELYFFSLSSSIVFGFSSVVNDYRIVRLIYEEDDRIYRGQVYSLRTDSWKELETGALRHYYIHALGVCVNGTMFWCAERSKKFIVAFDIATEVFTLIPVDTLPLKGNAARHGLFPSQVYAYGNKLAMCEVCQFVDGNGSRNYYIYKWVIEEGAGELGKIYSCDERERIGAISNDLKLLCIWRNEVVCEYGQTENTEEADPTETKEEAEKRNFLYLYNLTTKKWKKFRKFCGAHKYDWCDVFSYERSLVSVYNNN